MYARLGQRVILNNGTSRLCTSKQSAHSTKYRRYAFPTQKTSCKQLKRAILPENVLHANRNTKQGVAQEWAITTIFRKQNFS